MPDLGLTTVDDMASNAGQMNFDFSKFVDPTPLAVHPRLPLETVMELFKKLGPRVILVEHRGRLTGLVTVKDCLKYQFKVEHQEHPRAEDTGTAELDEKIWQLISSAGEGIASVLRLRGNGRLQLGSSPSRNLQARGGADGATLRTDADSRDLRRSSDDIVELEDR